MTFFDVESLQLSRQAQATTHQFRLMVGNVVGQAKSALSPHCVHVTIIGHNDTAEASTSGDRLGLERAIAVRAVLIAEGLPEDAISAASVEIDNSSYQPHRMSANRKTVASRLDGGTAKDGGAVLLESSEW